MLKKILYQSVICCSFSYSVYAQKVDIKIPQGVKFIEKGRVIEGSPELYKFELANGLRVLLLSDKRNPVAKFYMQLDAGSNREILGKTGLAHFFEHMMFRKSKNFAEGNFEKLFKVYGGSNNAYTSTNEVVFYETFPTPALEKILEIEADRFKFLDLKDPYFSIEKQTVLSERTLNYDNNAKNLALEQLRHKIYAKTKYEWFTIGNRKDVEALSIENTNNFYNLFYKPNNALLVIGSAFDAQTMLNLVHKYFSTWTGKTDIKHDEFSKEVFDKYAKQEVICNAKISNKEYSLNYYSEGVSIDDYIYLFVFNKMMDKNDEGKLEYRLQKKNLANKYYYSKNFLNKHYPILNIGFTLSANQDFSKTKDFWFKVVDEVYSKKITNELIDELLKVQNIYLADISLKMTTLLDNYVESEKNFKNPFIDAEIIKKLKNLKEAEFKKWIKNNLNKDKLIISGIVPNGATYVCDELNK